MLGNVTTIFNGFNILNTHYYSINIKNNFVYKFKM